MFRSLLFSLLLLPSVAVFAQQKLISYEKITTCTKAEFDSLLTANKVPKRMVPIRHDVDIYTVTYRTHWHDGSTIKATGLYMVPADMKEEMPLLAYNHGSRLKKKRKFGIRGMEAICAFYAADGYAVAMPDYVGLGKGDRRHLYHHSETEAFSTVDLLRAVREINAEIGKKPSDMLFLSGYSQGGHAAMATHKVMQQQLSDEFQVTASAPVSGAYDLAGVQGELLYEPYSDPAYLPYLLYSFQEIYHILPDSASYLVAPFDTLLPRFFTGRYKMGEVNAILPARPIEIVKPALVHDFENNPDNPLRKAMEANSLIDWAPAAPMQLCYCKGDKVVTWKNAKVARKAMRERGAKQVELRRAGGRKFDHVPCALYATIYTKMWFDSIRDGHPKGRRGPLWNRFLLSMGKLTYRRKK